MENYVRLTGTLDIMHRFNERVGNCKLTIAQESNGKVYTNKFGMTVFQPVLDKLSEVPLGSVVTLEGRLKNSSYERDNVTTWKLEVICSNFKVVKLAEPGSHQSEIPF